MTASAQSSGSPGPAWCSFTAGGGEEPYVLIAAPYVSLAILGLLSQLMAFQIPLRASCRVGESSVGGFMDLCEKPRLGRLTLGGVFLI